MIQAGGDAARTAIRYEALVIQGGIVASDGYVALVDGHVEPQGLQDAATDLVGQRVVAEEGEVSWPAARGNAVSDGEGEATLAAACHPVQVGRTGSFQLGATFLRVRQSAETIHDEENDFSLGLLREAFYEVEIGHYAFRSCNAATPGRVLPSRNSRAAPPPVETWVISFATPKVATASAVEPPPTMVVAPARVRSARA